MTYATVMVSVAPDQPNEARLEVACQLAERFEAAIIGIAAAQILPPLYFADGAAAQILIDQGEQSIKRRLAELEEQFRAAIKERARAVEWRNAVDFPARYILQEARCADIVVSGGHSPAFSDSYSLATSKDLVMEIGRPLLTVPDSVNWLDLRSVLVAWKDTREARRAVADALPMLQKADEVTVVEIPDDANSRFAAVSRVRDVVTWLSRHGVSASERVAEMRDQRDPAGQLDHLAVAAGAGLVVAGAYGHSRFREMILGGVTQSLITQSARCVLLSH